MADDSFVFSDFASALPTDAVSVKSVPVRVFHLYAGQTLSVRGTNPFNVCVRAYGRSDRCGVSKMPLAMAERKEESPRPCFPECRTP